MSSRDTILVTGGAGYIGSHTVNQLIKNNFNVVVLDNLSTGFRVSVDPEAVFIEGDILDFNLLKNLLNYYQVKAVVHFAAKLIVPESFKMPLIYYQNNTNGILVLVQAMSETGTKNLVFSSTAAVYGNQKDSTKAIKETDPLNPENPYGFSKYFSEQIIKDSSISNKISSIILRYFNVAGASLDISNGQRSKDATHLIKIAAEAACGKRDKVFVFGNNYQTLDGTGIRDYIHVDDLAWAHVLSCKKLLENKESILETLNCGYGKGFSVLEVLRIMKYVSKKDFKIEFTDRRAGDVSSLIADTNKVSEFLKWEPKYNDLALICNSAYEWEKTLTR